MEPTLDVAQQLGDVDVQMVFRIYGKFIQADYRKPPVTLKVVVPGGSIPTIGGPVR
jgi:hypothetical protein